MRVPHYLRGNKTVELPHAAIWTDTETDQIQLDSQTLGHRLRFGYACFQRTRQRQEWTNPEWCRYTTPLAFWKWVEKRSRAKTRLYLFAHNWSFDAPVLKTFSILPKRGWKLSRAIVESPPVVISWRRDNRTLTMLDTLNWWRMPLRQIGTSVGFPKLVMPHQDAPLEEWNRYAQADVEVIRRAMLAWWAFLRHYDLGGFAHTLAGQAFKAYRHRFMKHKILIDSDPKPLQIARASYHGGRVEAFFIGTKKERVHCFDVNSMYPFVMREREFPTVLKSHCRRVRLDEMKRWLECYSIVARVKLRTDSPQYAHYTGHKLIFPVGTFVAELTTPDIKAALEQGHITEITDACIYEQAPIFRSFVDTLYGLRLEAKAANDSVNTWLLKILMNSLYGKFAQRGNVWETVSRCENNVIEVWRELDYETGITYSMRKFGGLVQEKRKKSESYDSHPAIASHVTAYARRYLWELMTLAGRDNVLYCDTDSLYVTEAGRLNLLPYLDEKRLGGLKHEGTWPWIRINGPKDYAMPRKTVIKGVKLKARKLGPNRYEQEQWSTLKGLMRSGTLEVPTTRTVVKVLARVYDKGTVTISGNVLPLRLDD